MSNCDRVRIEELASCLGVLNHPDRVRLLTLLGAAGESVCVCELVDVLDLPQYTVSRHLKVLARAGWVTGEHDGPWVYYTPVSSPLLEALQPCLSPTAEDEGRLRARLALRERGRCVVGPKDAARG